MIEIQKKLNGIDPLSLKRTKDNSIYMKYHRASKVIEKITKENTLPQKIIDDIHNQYKPELSIDCNDLINDGESEISPRSIMIKSPELNSKCIANMLDDDSVKQNVDTINEDEVYVIDSCKLRIDDNNQSKEIKERNDLNIYKR